MMWRGLEAFPRDKETYGIPDNEMYRSYKRKKSASPAFFDKASDLVPRSWHSKKGLVTNTTSPTATNRTIRR